MKQVLIAFFLIALIVSARSQQPNSIFYNENGKLNADTSLSISIDQFKTWIHAEPNLIAYFSQIDFPLIYLENNVRQKNILIASFICGSDEITEVKVLNDSSAYAQAVERGILKEGNKIALELKESSSIMSKGIYKGKYYIAISFELIDHVAMMKNLKAVPIIRGTVPLISIGQY